MREAGAVTSTQSLSLTEVKSNHSIQPKIMKIHIPLTILTLVSLTLEGRSQSSSSHAAEANTYARDRESIRQTAQNLYRAVRREHIYGLPTPERMRELSLFLTPALQSIFASGDAWQKRQIELHPDDKPELVESDLFSSHDAGPTHWELDEVFFAPSVDATVKVKCAFKEEGQPDMLWTDELVFKNENGRWFLDDIRFGGSWIVASKNLRSLLPGGKQQTVNHLSPDDNWQVIFSADKSKVHLLPADKSDVTPFVLLNPDTEPATKNAWVVWSPNSDKVAITFGPNPGFTQTRIFHLEGGKWRPVQLATLFPTELKNLADNGFVAKEHRTEAHHWQDNGTLVIDCFGHFTKSDDFDGFAKQVSVEVLPDGTSKVTGVVEKSEL